MIFYSYLLKAYFIVSTKSLLMFISSIIVLARRIIFDILYSTLSFKDLIVRKQFKRNFTIKSIQFFNNMMANYNFIVFLSKFQINNFINLKPKKYSF